MIAIVPTSPVRLDQHRRPSGPARPGALRSAFALAAGATGPLLFGAVVAQILAALGAPVLAALAGILVNRVVGGQPVTTAVLALVGVFIGQRLAGLAMSSLMTLAQEHAAAEAAARFVEKATTIDAEHHHDAAFHDRMRHAEEIADGQFGNVINKLVGLCGAVTGLLGLVGVLATISVASAALVLAAMVPWVIADQRGFAIVKRTVAQLLSLRRRQSYYRSLVTHDDAALELLASGAGATVADRHRALSQEILRRERPAHMQQFVLIAVGNVAGGVLLMAAFLTAVSSAVAASPGQVATLIAALTGFLQTSATFANSTSGLLRDLPYLRDYFEFLDTPPLLRAEPAFGNAAGSERGVTFEGVSFTYPGGSSAVLRDVSLCIQPGELLALVGENGAGKSTLVKLLLRFYDPDAGSIVVDGASLRSREPRDARAGVAVLFQDFARYQLTLRDAVALGDRTGATDDNRVLDALGRAGLHSFVERLDRGLDSQLGRLFPGGHDLSGGEWQRIALARVLYRDAPVVVLDEPTSSLDPAGEEAIFTTLRESLGDKTGIIISHRFSTVRSADHIAVIADGTVAEHGTHDQLYALGGRYAKMFDLQAAHYR